jgi:putative mRNA 3-end processing factor
MPTAFKYNKGIRFYNTTNDVRFIADPTTTKAAQDCNAAFITHAHTDHSIAFPNVDIKVYSTKIASFLYEKLTSRKVKNTQFAEFNKKINIENIDVEFLPAGHLLGAAQIMFYFDDLNILYTGDLSTDEMLTVPKASIPEEQTDILLIESTYGLEEFVFDSREKIKTSILKWVVESLQKNRIPVINIGHLGPAQEIISYLNGMLSVDIYCDLRTSEINKVYENEGIKLNWTSFDSLNDSDFKSEKGVVLLPRATKELPLFLNKKKTSRAMITGQAIRFHYSSFEQAFPFSMHSNCRELLEFIEKVNPKKVYTLYAYDAKFAEIIEKKLKIKSQKLKAFTKPTEINKKKKTLDEFKEFKK